MTSFFLAWQFLTILPGGRRDREASPRLLGRSMAFYPLVGFLLGLVLWAASWAFSLAFPRAVGDGLVILLLVLFTGALHLDGLADTLDGMAVGRSAEERLLIMKDHRVWTFGAVALTMGLGIKFLALNSLPGAIEGKSLAAAMILGRWSMVQLIYRAPYARPEGGLGKVFKENVKSREMILAGLTSLIFAVLLFQSLGFFLWLIIGVFTLGIQAWFRRKIGGVTGDVLGAANEMNEILALLLISGMFPAFF
jgi:adenosylcobinamide-GDP ribazoletransferase